MQDLLLSSYDFHLPPELIAQRPVSPRHASRLLVYDEAKDQITHSTFLELPNFLPEASTLVFNESKVFPCRLLAHKESGGAVEIFLLSLQSKNGVYHALVKSSKKKKVGDRYLLPLCASVTIAELRGDGTFGVTFDLALHASLESYLKEHALVPIPPYIRHGESDEQDVKDYQTVYAKEAGSVAAPTAGLHFTEELFKKLKAKSILPSYVTLHVGMGTFKPVTADNILDHKMHFESFIVDGENAQKIKAASSLFAVGTTSLRTLETYKSKSLLPDHWYETDIFLHPGIEVRSIDGLITNFHLPKSSLLMLVSAILGREKTLALYDEAIKEKYRFFSYGDGMLIFRKPRIST